MTGRIGQLTRNLLARYENSALDNASLYLYRLIVLHKKKIEAAPVAWSACHIQIEPSAFPCVFVPWIIPKLT